MNSGSSGSLTSLHYDQCSYNQQLAVSGDILSWMLDVNKYENCGKCVFNGHYTRPFDANIVDRESELTNRTRNSTICNSNKYHPKCTKSPHCVNTYDPSNPVVLAPEVCPIVYNNIARPTAPGYALPADFSCPSRK